MLCLVTIHWSQSWGPKVHGAQPPDWGAVPTAPVWAASPCSAADDYDTTTFFSFSVWPSCFET